MLINRLLIAKIILYAGLLLLQINVFSQAYTYDSNGNLSHDGNKQITLIHYNLLNLPDTISYTDGRKIIYTYSATGQKLREQAFATNGASVQKHDYINDFLYRNDTLREIEHGEGRVVPILPGTGASAWEYQYHLTDHLGNVRSTLTSSADTIEYLATMESTQALQEQKIFSQLSERRVTFTSANHTLAGHEVARLFNNTANGFSMNLAVKSGDMINLKAYAYYEGNAINNADTKANVQLNSLLPVVMSVLSGGVSVVTEGPSNVGFTNLTHVLAPAKAPVVPIAHLNYQLFDKSYNQIDAGFVAITEKASYAQELLILAPLKIKKSGYLLVYLSNTSVNNTAVYFDDVQVQHILSPVIQEDGYYPFGMAMDEQHDARFKEEPNRHRFNGKELQSDFDLNWYDYGARMYDATLGRFNHLDRFSEKYYSNSPYSFVANNPVCNVDVHGDSIWVINGADKILYENWNLYTVKNGSKTSYKGTRDGFLKAAINGLNTLMKTADGSEIINELQSSDFNFVVTDAQNNPDRAGKSAFIPDDPDGANAISHWDQGILYTLKAGSGGIIYWNAKANTYDIPYSPEAVLGHELFHGTDANKGWIDKRPVTNSPTLGRDEYRAIYEENRIRQQLGVGTYKIDGLGELKPMLPPTSAWSPADLMRVIYRIP